MKGSPDTRQGSSQSFGLESTSASMEEKDGLLEHDGYRSARRTPRHCSHMALASALAVSNVFLIVLLAIQFRSDHAKPQDDGHRNQQPIPLGGLPSVDEAFSWLPPEEWRTEIFRPQKIFGLEPDSAAGEAWRSFIPKGKGFVMIKNTTRLPDLPGLRHPDKKEQQACIAIFHQLHCLYMTYAAYWTARAGKFEDVPPNHLIHCWDYLRQSIMCAGDTSLEWVSEYQPLPNATTGWGFQHTCKRFDAIYDWAEQHRSKEKEGIA